MLPVPLMQWKHPGGPPFVQFGVVLIKSLLPDLNLSSGTLESLPCSKTTQNMNRSALARSQLLSVESQRNQHIIGIPSIPEPEFRRHDSHNGVLLSIQNQSLIKNA